MTGPALCILAPDPADPDFSESWKVQAERLNAALAPAGLAPVYRAWTGDHDFARFDLVLPLLVWGYHRDPARWIARIDAFEEAGVRLANPAQVLRWNMRKTYLLDFAARGVPVVETVAVESLDDAGISAARAVLGDGELLAKPPVSATAHGILRINGAPVPADALGKPMLVQRFLPAILEEGEYSLLFFGGRFSHATLKRARPGDFRVQSEYGGTDISVDPPPAAMETARRMIEAIGEPPLYARIDLVGDGKGGYELMEAELIEPQLFLERSSDQGLAFALAVRDAASRVSA